MASRNSSPLPRMQDNILNVAEVISTGLPRFRRIPGPYAAFCLKNDLITRDLFPETGEQLLAFAAAVNVRMIETHAFFLRKVQHLPLFMQA